MIENSVVFFPCSSIERTTKFYTEIVGLPVVQEQAGGMCKIFDTGYGYIGFCEYGDDRLIPGGDRGLCISFNCHDEEDVDRHYEALIRKGVTNITKPCLQEKFPVYASFTRDPDDYRVEFQRILLDQELTGGRNRV